ncbi:hypothetical protein R3W88_018597 [Solanum pinnatisectum]|uniref:Uncharacterized protein n=1 Tax=Solanum pinnatisectum TaxID=50273 RepID=A0AAV9L639_9SOLN|nr:hypothetical protein R3W88_018597 [Solanum pinnatisectum]
MPQGRQKNENTSNGREMPHQNQVNKGTNRRRGIGIVSRRFDEITGDIGYQPRFEVKWNEKSAITSNRL